MLPTGIIVLISVSLSLAQSAVNFTHWFPQIGFVTMLIKVGIEAMAQS